MEAYEESRETDEGIGFYSWWLNVKASITLKNARHPCVLENEKKRRWKFTA